MSGGFFIDIVPPLKDRKEKKKEEKECKKYDSFSFLFAWKFK